MYQTIVRYNNFIMWDYHTVSGLFHRMGSGEGEAGKAGVVYAGEAGKEWENI